MRGAVPAGMCIALERAGLLSAFDRIYGCSSGAITACYAAAGQAELWATSYVDTACKAFIAPSRALRRRPVLDLAYLFETVIGERRPLSPAGLARGPALRIVTVAQETGELRVLGGFDGVADALAAARASCAIPLVAGAAPAYRGEPMVDGGLLEPIPFRSALREGATHVLVLRSRPADWRSRPHRRAAELPLARAHRSWRRSSAPASGATTRPRTRWRRTRAAPAARWSGRSRSPPARGSSGASAPTPRRSPTASGSARRRWPARSAASSRRSGCLIRRRRGAPPPGCHARLPQARAAAQRSCAASHGRRTSTACSEG